MKKVSILIPVYNEAGNIAPMLEALDKTLSDCYLYEILFIDDGSSDKTLELLKAVAESDSRVHYISFARNFGQQNALKAGMDLCTGDCAVMLDGDLQHPPELIPKMLELWDDGYEIVYTRRKEDRRLSLYKRLTSSLFHRILRSMSGMHIEQGIADFRLLDRKVLDVLASFHEPDLFLRGIVQWMGYRRFGLDYMPEQRFTGETKYNSIKLIKHAVQGITSFSVKPLYIAVFLGLLFVALSMSYLIYVLWRATLGLGASGWASTIVTVMFFGGLNMLLLGIIGIYVGKIFIQTKRRPTYIVREMN